MNETNTMSLIEALKAKGFRTLSDWSLSLGNPYSDYLVEMFGQGEVWFSSAMYSPFEILNAIVSYEGGLASAYQIVNLVNLIDGTNLR